MKTNLNAEFSNIIVHQDSFNEEIGTATPRTIHTLAGECVGNKIYLYNMYNNCICKIDKTTGKIDVECGDTKKPYYEAYLYLKSVVYQHIICFISDKAENVLKFDTITGKKEWIYFKGNGIDFEPALYESMLYLLPVGYSEQLICIDLTDNSVKYLPTYYSVRLNRTLRVEPYIYGRPLRLDDWVYRGSNLEPCIQKFHLKTGAFEYIAVNNFNRPIRSLAFDGEHFWILSKTDGMIACWDEKRNKMLTSINLSLESQKEDMLYAACFYANGIVFILEQKGTCILELNVKEFLLESYDCGEIPGFRMVYQEKQAFAEYIRLGNDGAIYFFPFKCNGVVVKEKNGCVYFYKSETVKGLAIAVDQQMQSESTCTLNCFCKKIEMQNRNTVNETHVGTEILQDICKTSK